MEKALELARRFEGLRLKAYRCPAGVWTIGFGSTAGVKPGDAITKERAEELLQEDMLKAALGVIAQCPILLMYSDKLSAGSDFVFNLGEGRLKISTLRKRINEKRWNDAKKELRKWVWGGGKKLPGLVLRREAEAKLL